jgi:hypothetical protein
MVQPHFDLFNLDTRVPGWKVPSIHRMKFPELILYTFADKWLRLL